MAKGRKRLPSAVHELKGSYQKNPKRRRKKEPKPPSGNPTCPRYLDRIGKGEWRHVTKLLDNMGVLSLADKSALAMYCQTFSEWRKAVKMCQEHGAWSVTFDEQGNPETKRNMWDSVRERTAEACRKWLVEFGLTPSARTKIEVDTSTKDDFDQFLTRFWEN